MDKSAMFDPSADPSHELISSARLEMTPFFIGEQQLGVLHSVMIHKITGQVGYAVISLFHPVNTPEQVYPVPWDRLTYDPALGGYVADVTVEQIANGPPIGLDDSDRPSTAAFVFDEVLHDADATVIMTAIDALKTRR